jgi:hypothetical protein
MKEKIDFWRKTTQNKKVGAIALKSIALIVMPGTPRHAIDGMRRSIPDQGCVRLPMINAL